MDVSTKTLPVVFKEERFRTPLRTERQIGLWVDRIGSGGGSEMPARFRVLGQYAAVYVTRGQGEFHSPSTGVVPVRAGEAMLLFPREPHRYGSRAGWQTQWIVWNGPDAERLEALGYLGPQTAVVPDPLGAVEEAFTALAGIMAREDLAAVLERKTLVLTMLLRLHQSSRSIGRRPGADQLMRQAVAYLAREYASQIPVDELARRFKLSPTHFRRLFKEFTGRSPREFVTAQRMSRAKALLSAGLPVKEVAARVGYDDVFYFMRVFKKVAGTSPGRYALLLGG